MTEEEFVAQLYDAILDGGRQGEFAVQFEDTEEDGLSDQLSSKSWQWIVLGDRVFWFLQIRDYRPPINGQPYQLDAMHNFFPWAQELKLATPHRIRGFLQVLINAMDAQTLGQHEASGNPQWAQCREFFNPWANRFVIKDSQPEITKQEFLKRLYDRLLSQELWPKQTFWLPSPGQLHPRQPHFQDSWHWKLQGSRTEWWLEIVDPYHLGSEYPYRIAQDDPAFFETAHFMHLVNDIDTFIDAGLITAMEEGDLGQDQARRAYDQGAISSTPPWIHTHNPI